MVRAAIVGLGRWGRTLVDSVQNKSDEISFVAGTTRTLSKAEDYCRDNKIDLREDLDAILGDPDIDAVVLATPHSQHEEDIKRIAGAGKHLYTEKPFALNVASAKSALEVVEKAGIVLGIGYQRRFHPSIAEMRRRIQDGSLGTVACCHAEITMPGGLTLPKDSWRISKEEAPAGALTALGVHVMDGFLDLCGEVDEVYCVTAQRAAPLIYDTTIFTMKHKNGIISTSVSTLASAPNYSVAVFGSKGIAQTTRPSLDSFRFLPAPGSDEEPQEFTNEGFDMLRAGLESFAAAVRGDAPFPISVDEILHGVAVFEAIVKTAETEQPVKVG